MNQKQYKAIFFDWDGTAVMSRKAPVDEAVAAMKPLLAKGVKLVIVSGTTYENIAGGNIQDYFTGDELKNLWLGLGRGAYNYRFREDGTPYIWKNGIPDKNMLLAIHDTAYAVHRHLLEQYGFPTDVVFSRPNYCKIDLMVDNHRGDQLFFQSSELDEVITSLTAHGFAGGLSGLVTLSEKIAKSHGLTAVATTDAKYLEVGTTSKSDNINQILSCMLQEESFSAQDCTYWGDEYIGLDDGLFGSDSFMRTEISIDGDFFDVSEAKGTRPEGVVVVGGGVKAFLDFLRSQ